MSRSSLSRRRFLRNTSLAAAALAGNRMTLPSAWSANSPAQPHDAPLDLFPYGDVLLSSDLHDGQLRSTHAVLMELSEDSLLKPFRQMAGQPAPGDDLGGWYDYDPNYDSRNHFNRGFCPGASFGQWVSALARSYAINGDAATREKVLRLNQAYAQTISPDFYIKAHFPAYTYDKIVCGLIDAHSFAQDPQAFAILDRVTDTAMPLLPSHAVEQNIRWRTVPDPDDPSWWWDESYTLPENLFLAYQRGAGQRYYGLAQRFLYDQGWFDPLSQNENVLNGHHAYSHVNSLSSAMMAYFAAGSEKHFHAAQNAFAMVEAQSFATGGWGPDERLRAPGTDDLYDSLTKTHASFETPCGSYGHFKITRYLLRATRNPRYGDSMERVMYNTVLGAKQLEINGDAFYYSDYNYDGHRVYHPAKWPCCSGTLPQIAADYRISAYFRAPQAVYVNLYIPSTLRWQEGGAALSLTQDSEYPYEGNIALTLTATQPTELALNFRIPAWAEGASILVNGKRQPGLAVPGQFAALRRTWKTGDRVELELPLTTRLEAIDSRHPDTVALLRGPLVLMALKPEQKSPLPQITRTQLMAAQRVSQRQWQAAAAGGQVTLLPFTEIGDRPYTTYLQVG